MIKLENAGGLPQSRCLLVIQSETEAPSVSLTTENVREQVDGEWVDSQMNVRQVVSAFVEGKPFKLGAKIAQMYAVECPAAFKVVVEIEAKTVLSSAYEKGDKSKESTQVSMLRVVEVWASSTKSLWKAKDGGNGATEPAATLDSGGRIQKSNPLVARS